MASGIEVSSLYPNLANHVDDMCFLRSIYGDSVNHAPALFEMNTGSIMQGILRWVMGNLSDLVRKQESSGFVVMLDHRGGLSEARLTGTSGFMPATYQGTVFAIRYSDPRSGSRAGCNAETAARQPRSSLLTERETSHLPIPVTAISKREFASYELHTGCRRMRRKSWGFIEETEETKALYVLTMRDREIR